MVGKKSARSIFTTTAAPWWGLAFVTIERCRVKP